MKRTYNTYKLLSLCVMIMILLLSSSCMKERYRKDRRNRMTSRTKVAINFLSRQAVKLTQRNIELKDENEKAAMKRKNRQQADLNELNSKSKVKPQKKHSGHFNLY